MVIDPMILEQYGPMPFELLEVDGAGNVRDLGGYVGLDGMRIMPRRFVRAGSLAALTEQGMDQLAALGVDCVIDLRSRYEAEKMPDRIAGDPRFSCHHVPMLDYINSNPDEENLLNFPSSMAEMYVGLLDKAGHSFRQVFAQFADPANRCCLFHCTAGKDRTGMSAMLLLSLAGVDPQTIVEDYRWSERLLEAPLTRLPDDFSYLLESAPATMQAALDHLHGHYGGIEPYLDHIGVDASLRAQILTKLFEA